MRKNTIGYYLIGMLFVAIQTLPFIISTGNHYICVHDFLDSSVAHIKMMKDTGAFFDFSRNLPLMSGLPRYLFGGCLDIKLWLFAVLPSYKAIMANMVIIKASAFAGMFLFLTRYVFPDSDNARKVALYVAVLFSFVPFYPDYGITSAGIPLVAYAFLNLYYRKDKVVSLLLLVYYTMFSSFVLGGFFICVSVAVLLIVWTVKDRKIPWCPLFGLCFFSIMCVIINWQMIMEVLHPYAEMHRVEFVPNHSVLVALGNALSYILISQYHAGCCLAVVILSMFIYAYCRYKVENRMFGPVLAVYLILSGLILVTSVAKPLFPNVKIIQMFQFDRFYFFCPAMYFVMAGISVLELMRHNKVRMSWIFMSVLLVGNICFDRTVSGELMRICGAEHYPTYRQFYDESLFNGIKKSLPICGDSDKVVCLGMYPAVAEYNGIYTLDGYTAMYPLEHKHRFQRVIQGELDKSEELRSYFCDWGSRCYLFSSELGRNYMFSSADNVSVSDLSIDCEALRGMGCRYILSSVSIKEYESLGLRFAGSFRNDDSYWNIRVYEL